MIILLVDVSRFRREARLLASLQHPAIVACYQAGVTRDDTAFMVMEYVAGPHLRQYITDDGPLTIIRTVSVLIDLAEALSYAFEQGVIHRDIKGENILLEPLDDMAHANNDFPFAVKIADLGLAREQRTEPKALSDNVTVAGAIIGSPRYMAPEQYNNPEQVDQRVDIYALACLGVLFDDRSRGFFWRSFNGYFAGEIDQRYAESSAAGWAYTLATFIDSDAGA